MAEQFCKLYETENGQILVKLSSDSDGDPEVRIYAQPEGLGVCSIAAKYEDTDEGWDRAESVFAGIDEASAIEMSKPIFLMGDKIEVEAAHG